MITDHDYQQLKGEKMKNKMLRFMMLIAMLFSALTPATQVAAQIESASSKGVSPAGMLNPDGTLNLSGDFNGSLDLAGYSVQMDPKRGPVFGPASNVDSAPASAAASGNWAALGDGAGNFNNQINDIAISGTDVYVVGSFMDVANIPAADYVAKWNGTSWSALGANGAGDGALNGQATAVAMSGTDVYLGGYFDKVYNGASQVSDAAYIAKWDGSNWLALGNGGAGIPSLNGPASDIVVSGTDVYAGGWFTDVKDGVTTLTEADYVAKWDTASSHWSALGNGGAGIGSLNNGVNALVVNGANVYVGGYFTDVKDGAATLTEADYVAKWDGTNWSALGNDGAGNGSLSSSVFTLAINGTDLYVGGGFNNVKNGLTTVTGSARIARWDGANWNALGNPLFDNEVRSLIVDASGNIYAGGVFTNVTNNGTPLPDADYVAKFDGTNWSAVGNDGAGNGSIPNKSHPYTAVKALAMLGSTLFVGGYFFDVNDGGTVQSQADHLTSWDGTHWSSVGTNVNGTFFDPTNPIKAIAVIGTDVYVGGRFTDISNHGVNLPEADYIVKWDGMDWSAVGNNGAGNGALGGEVSALAVSGTDLYVGGWFLYLNNGGTYLPAAQYIAKWDGTNWSALGSTAALNYAVFSITVDGSGNVYAGGGFTNAASIPEADYIAKWDGANWSALGNSGAAGVGALNHWVNALGVSGSNVYAGGYFTNAASIPEADYIAKWDGSGWAGLGSNGGGNGSLDAGVFALAVSGSNVYVGGTFLDVNNNGAPLLAADYIAKWDGSGWSALGSNGAGDGSLNTAVFAIAVSGADVFAGGNFINVNNKGALISEADYIAKWDGTDWSALGSNGAGNGALSLGAHTMTVNGTDLLVGGWFGDVSNSGTVIGQADRLAVWGIVPHVPVTLTVTKLADTTDSVCDADCSLREAIGAAKTGDTIIFAAGLSGTITLGTTLIVDKSITITGPGASTLSVSGSDAVRVFQIESGKTVTISNLTISHGYATGANGGGIYNAGMLTITNSQITTNTASLLGGGIYNAPGASLSLTDTVVDHNMAYGDGGGLYLPNPGAVTPGTINLNRVGVTDNVSSGSGGGGIFLSASANISNSLIANNTTSGLAGAGGGLKIFEGGAGFAPITVSVTNVTISGNTTFSQGGGVDVSLQQAADAVTFNNVTIADNHRNMMPGPPAIHGGGGVFASGPEYLDIENSIIAGNTSGVGGADCEGAIHSLDYNLIQNTTSCTINGTTTHNLTGVSAILGPLANNGGSTLTMSLLAGSPAINAADDATCAITDQRGNARAGNGPNCDIGSYEYLDSAAPTVSMSSTAANRTNNSPIAVTVTFSENVTGFTEGDIVTSNGTVGNFATTDASHYTFNLTPSSNGLVTADIAAGVASDLAGNGSTAATQFSRTYDTIAPTVTMSSAANNPTNSSPISITVQFSETVTGFSADDIIPSNGTASNFAAVDGDTYTFDLIPSAQGSVTADIAAGVASDLAGNGSAAATQFSRTYTVTTIYNLFLPLILR